MVVFSQRSCRVQESLWPELVSIIAPVITLKIEKGDQMFVFSQRHCRIQESLMVVFSQRSCLLQESFWVELVSNIPPVILKLRKRFKSSSFLSSPAAVQESLHGRSPVINLKLRNRIKWLSFLSATIASKNRSGRILSRHCPNDNSKD
jgi:hypothetical protein